MIRDTVVNFKMCAIPPSWVNSACGSSTSSSAAVLSHKRPIAVPLCSGNVHILEEVHLERCALAISGGTAGVGIEACENSEFITQDHILRPFTLSPF